MVSRMVSRAEEMFREKHGEPPVVGGRRIQLIRASEIKTGVVRWLWKDRIPQGEITIIAGREGLGKSLITSWWTAQISRGTLPGVYEGEPKPVVIAATEDSWKRTIVPRLMAAGADLNMVYQAETVQVDIGTSAPLVLPSDLESLKELMTEIGAVMLVCDPLSSMVDSRLNENQNQQLRAALEPIKRFAEETRISVIGIAHFTKDRSKDPMDAITGSRAYGAVVRAGICVARDPDAEDGSYVLSQEKNNLGRLDIPSLRYITYGKTVETDEGPSSIGALKFIGETEVTVGSIRVNEARNGHGGSATDDRANATKVDAAAEWLKSYLETDKPVVTPRGAGQYAKVVLDAGKDNGFSPATVQRARDKMPPGLEVILVPQGRNSIWVLRKAPTLSVVGSRITLGVSDTQTGG